MSDRFFSAAPVTTNVATLDGPEAHHLLHVMRARPGERVTLFDGSGAEFDAVVEHLSRSTVTFRVGERREIDRELPYPLIVGVALPKGDRQKWLVEKLTELGVTELVPLVTDRGVAQPSAGSIERLTRTVIEASKQCGRNRLMRISQSREWCDWIAVDPVDKSERRLLAHPGGEPLASLPTTPPSPTRLAIGPEGGISDAELAGAVAAGWCVCDLGKRILRVETAAITFVAATVSQAI
jgi:16S rRNA (uracil1498-N3)-methyltransferase